MLNTRNEIEKTAQDSSSSRLLIGCGDCQSIGGSGKKSTIPGSFSPLAFCKFVGIRGAGAGAAGQQLFDLRAELIELAIDWWHYNRTEPLRSGRENHFYCGLAWRPSLLETLPLFNRICAASKSYNLIAFIARLKSQTSVDVGSSTMSIKLENHAFSSPSLTGAWGLTTQILSWMSRCIWPVVTRLCD